MSPTAREQVLQLLLSAPTGLRAPELMRALRPRASQPTLWRILDGLRSEGELIVEGRGRATRYRAVERTGPAQLRSRLMHQHVARRLARDPALRIVARERLGKLRKVNPHGRVYHDRWESLLDAPLATLLRAMTEDSDQADTLRKESPMTILVTPEERRRVFATTRAA